MKKGKDPWISKFLNLAEFIMDNTVELEVDPTFLYKKAGRISRREISIGVKQSDIMKPKKLMKKEAQRVVLKPYTKAGVSSS